MLASLALCAKVLNIMIALAIRDMSSDSPRVASAHAVLNAVPTPVTTVFIDKNAVFRSGNVFLMSCIAIVAIIIFMVIKTKSRLLDMTLMPFAIFS